jgi:hypothetical protein
MEMPVNMGDYDDGGSAPEAMDEQARNSDNRHVQRSGTRTVQTKSAIFRWVPCTGIKVLSLDELTSVVATEAQKGMTAQR